MKKTINITIEEQHYNWLKDKNTNISAWMRALIIKKYNEDAVNISNKKEEFNKDFEVFNARSSETNS